ncbi:hypothetical protein DRU03_14240 [Salmonella enterica subsp. enterica serovar Typhimurium]|nr:hypothetical protein [Salmonella enterica subsp. enterica serovar Typhimurium]EBX3550209.1 hypothetical protein [Salmonella enterica subsp. enterica serovar Typhimurium]EBY8134126.1 hypothetical protein [Salmonella enterica subsp. enterica serovar Typhimurium]
MLFPIINELDVLSVSESYTKKMTKRKTPGHFCPGVSQFWEISTQIILVAGIPSHLLKEVTGVSQRICSLKDAGYGQLHHAAHTTHTTHAASSA